jgi:predicted MFS family arabinose efflux permease
VEGSAVLTQDLWGCVPIQENDDGSLNSKFLLDTSHAYVQRKCPMWCVEATKFCFQIAQFAMFSFLLPYLKFVFLLIVSFSPTYVRRTYDPVLTTYFFFEHLG